MPVNPMTPRIRCFAVKNLVADNANLDELTARTGAAQSDLPELSAEIETIIQSIVRFKLRGADASHEDHCQDARLQLLEWRRVTPTASADDLRSLAATIAWRVCAQYVRQRNPRFQALRNRVLYALTRQRGLAQWRERDKAVAGFAEWQDRRAALSPGRLRAVLEERAFIWQRQRWAGAQGPALIELLAAISIRPRRPSRSTNS